MSLPIWQGYMHTTTVLRANGLERFLDYHPVNKPNADLTYATEFIVPDCPGLYLKWLNVYGAYKYWLFNPQVTHEVTTRSLGTIANQQINRLTSFSVNHEIGKTSEETLQGTSRMTFEQSRIVSSIFESPEVYLYADRMPFPDFRLRNIYCGWIKVIVEDGSTTLINTKNQTENFNITIRLPDRYVQRLIQ